MDAKDIDWNSQELSPRLKKRLEKALADPRNVAAGKQAYIAPDVEKYDPVGEPQGVIADPSHFHPGYHSSTIIIVKEIGTFLKKTYPGWGWVVQVNEFGHMIYIMNQHLHPLMGARIRMEDVMYDHDNSGRVIKKNAGEILERFGMLQMGLRGENLSRLAHAPRDAAGNCIPEISDLPDKKAATQAEIARKIAKGEIQVYEINGQKFARIKK